MGRNGLGMVYVTGDMHGDEARLYRKEIRKLKENDTLIICGDFGFVWDGSAKEKKILDYLGSRKYNVCFIDGTHDNYDLINSYRETVFKGGRVHRISGSLFHMCRGQIFNIDGISIFTFGGGESQDKEIRTEHETWWKDEMPTPDEMQEGAENIDDANCVIDVIITHEPPSLVKSAILLRSGKVDAVSKLNGYFEELNRSCKFKKWFFGCVHEDRTITPLHTAVFKEVIKVEIGG